ncbi:type II CAAX prenyl endopeptidase Rce1 family protein [Natrinema versiforme]|uniref:CPBP family intramembrane metalloprotease n=1 Tax=Natrinema versiforme TaxID=88724 RepID=A0A4P8WLP7_9EURY|nr:CPBP family glutamic-type intramembrane protease [Natrinema versiforme]QCS44285.1 CPBP family intramembrane metalloprotease [Natrinema versiforme]
MSFSWVQKALLVGAVVTLLWMRLVPSDLDQRVVVDAILLIGGPLALGLAHGNRIGWRIDRVAIRNTVLLALFVAPFYVVGSTLPTIRAFYPIWETSAAPAAFIPHAIKLFVLALAAETYYRGLLCVGVKEIGFVAVFISPVVYMFHHASKPPIEFLLSGPTDVLFGAVDYKSNSILPSVVAHGGGLVLLDWLVLHEPLFDPTFLVRFLEWLPIPL